MQKSVLFVLLTICSTTASAWCYPGFHDSKNYNFEAMCDYDRIKDLYYQRTYDMKCSKGLIFYYYCIKN